ncbi:anti-repressor Ant [Lactobacillus phage T25]|uniref:DNA-binding helix-turn-helix protein n=2 Tax=root TaxID=1 RepID=A0A2Z6BEI9_9CAUD|nr:anti-repressor Ant [Lactobacillus phage T25]BBD20145.1 DNA-binding helix-turn-helix protein [Lactobacillus phage T25]
MPNKSANILGPVIKELRKQKKMTQADLSRITGIAQNTISNHENQNRALDENSIIKYAKALGVTPQALYDAAIVKKSIDTKSMVIDVRQTAIDEINDVVKELVTPRVQKVASYAEQQLDEQQNPDNVVSLDEARVERNLNEPTFDVEIDGIVAAGYGAFNDDRNEPMDTVKIPDSAIPLHGDSMSPYYEDGEFVFAQKTQDVTNGTIAVSGRELHDFLGVGKDFSNWFKDMASYGFEEGKDFSPFSAKTPNGGRPRIEYVMTLDMAKEVAMIQRTDRGKQARQYFSTDATYKVLF